MKNETGDYVVIGQILKPRGLKGELKIYPLTSDAERYKKLKSVYIEQKSYSIEKLNETGKFVFLKLEGINSVEESEKLRNKYICILKKDAFSHKPENNEYYYYELEGMKVYTSENAYLGVLEEILDYPAHDVYAVYTEGRKEILIPAIPEVIKKIDIEKRIMIVELFDGLID